MTICTRIGLGGQTLRVAGSLLFLFSLFIPAQLSAQVVVYDPVVRITPPAGWVEKQSWEVVQGSALPFYNKQEEAVAFVLGYFSPLSDFNGFRRTVGFGSTSIPVPIDDWPAEAARFSAMASDTLSVRVGHGNRALVGLSQKPGKYHYLGRRSLNGSILELAEWISKATLNDKAVRKLKLAPVFTKRRVHVVYGIAVFPETGTGYKFAAYRFASLAEGTSWIEPLLASVAPVKVQEQQAAENAGRVRELVANAFTHINDKDFSKANDAIKKAMDLSPDNPNGAALKGAMLNYQKRSQEAEAVLRIAASKHPENEEVHFQLGVAFLSLGKRDEAIHEFEAVQQISPVYPDIDQILAKAKFSP